MKLWLAMLDVCTIFACSLILTGVSSRVHVVSYRGPGAAGGVASALTQIFTLHSLPLNQISVDDSHTHIEDWWHIEGNQFKSHKSGIGPTIDDVLVDGHYRYCNNFLWPILHDFPEHARYEQEDRELYQAFNSIIAFQLRSFNKYPSNECFVNDYQMSLVPQFLKRTTTCSVFWHIPWPKQVPLSYTRHLCEIAGGLLHAKLIGFHTQEYRQNFFNFVDSHMPKFRVDFEKSVITGPETTSGLHCVNVVVAPLGINADYWRELSWAGSDFEFHFQLGSPAQPEFLLKRQPVPQVKRHLDMPYVLSVDRGDYTKGIIQRLDAIDEFFHCFPEYRGNIRFLQVGSKSREGLSEFDRYWQECRDRAATLNERWSTADWQPLHWIDSPQSATELAAFYRNAAMMIVSPLRDGLNLTAKEYIACQTSRLGVLALSEGAGVFSELGKHSITVDPLDSSAFAQSIRFGLSLSDTERYRRMRLTTDRLNENSLIDWWRIFMSARVRQGEVERLDSICC